ncbi:MAG: ABC transporter permease [Pseudomonadota bacterium]|jgi:putative spermidine/putrescine transport system permease protein
MRKANLLNGALLLPALVFLLLFFAAPLLQLFGRSVSGPDGFNTFVKLISTEVFRAILLNTIETGLSVTVTTLLIAFPIAWFLVICGERLSKLIFGIIIVSMWTSLLARLFSLSLLYKNTGPVNQLLLSMGLISAPLPMMNNSVGVLIGMFYTMLPFMVLPIYNTMSKIDPALMQAASVCGASNATIFWRVMLPLCLPGISTGCIIVFVTSMGYFIVPSVLGGAHDLMLAQFIVEQTQQFLNWAAGTAAAIYLLILTLIIYVVYTMLIGVATKREGKP